MHPHQHGQQPVPAATHRAPARRQHPLAALHQTVGNTAFSRMVIQRAPQPGPSTARPADELQAYVQNWEEKTKRTFKPQRSAQLVAIDDAITQWLTGGHRTPGLLDANETQLTTIRTAVQAWRASKTKASPRGPYIDGLMIRVDAALAEIRQRRAERARQQAELAKYGQIDPNLARFAVRTRRIDALDPTSQLQMAFAADRDPQGRLSDQSLTILDNIGRHQLRGNLATVAGVTPNSVTPAQVQQIMASNTNQVTSQTIYPELQSYLDTMTNQPALTAEQSSLPTTGSHETVTRTINGTTLTVHWDNTDSQRNQRLDSLRQAIELVQQQGYTVPPLTAYFPKYGRNLIVSPGRVTEGAGKIHRAEYIAPDALVASPELLNNPLTNQYGGTYHNLSTQLDPSGVGTMVHELGHFLHYHQNRATFHDLTATEFASGKAAVAAQVSGYAAQKPREFVAEVFLGLVHGRTFPADVMEMYDGLGGPTPGP
jgi:hypothetical protein